MAATYRKRRGWLPSSSAFNADLWTQINRVSRELAKETCVKRDKRLPFDLNSVNCVSDGMYNVTQLST